MTFQNFFVELRRRNVCVLMNLPSLFVAYPSSTGLKRESIR